MMVWRVLVVKSVRIPPYRISATALNKAEEDAGGGFMHYSCSRWTLVGASHPPPSHPSRQPPLMLLPGITRGAIHQYFAHHSTHPVHCKAAFSSDYRVIRKE